MQPKVRATTGCKSAKVVRESLRSLTFAKAMSRSPRSSGYKRAKVFEGADDDGLHAGYM